MGKEKRRLTFDGGLLDSGPNRIKKNNINNILITKIFLIKKYWFGESPWLSTTAKNIGKQKAKKTSSSSLWGLCLGFPETLAVDFLPGNNPLQRGCFRWGHSWWQAYWCPFGTTYIFWYQILLLFLENSAKDNTSSAESLKEKIGTAEQTLFAPKKCINSCT